MSSVPPAKFFVNRGIVSSRTDVYNLLRPLLKQTVTYRYLRGREVVTHGTGWVERIVIDHPEVSSYFTPLSICLNIDSFEHLEFETRARPAPRLHARPGRRADRHRVRASRRRATPSRRSRPASSNSIRAGSSRWSCSGSKRRTRSPVGGDRGRGVTAGAVPGAKSGGAGRACTIGRDVRTTALPEGPRVISARLPGRARSPIAAYVLAGSRLESPTRPASPTSWSTSRSRARALPDDAGHLRGDRGGRWLVQRRDRPRVDGLLGPRPVRDAERAMDVLGELIVRPTLDDAEIDSERDGDHRGDPLLPRRPGRIQPDPLPAGDVRRRAAGPRDLRRRGRHPRPARPTTIHDFWATTYRPANTVVAVSGDIDHEERSGSSTAAFGRGNGASPTFEPAPSLPAGERVRLAKRETTQAQHRRRRARRSGATIPTAGRSRCSTGSSATA